MENYQQIATFTYPSDLVIARTLLESNNINCYVKDELTVQVHNFYSNAIGGIRLELSTDKVHLAKELLKENGFKNVLIDTDDTNQDFRPLLHKFIKTGVHFVIISTIILLIIIFCLLIFTRKKINVHIAIVLKFLSQNIQEKLSLFLYYC